MVGTVAPWAAFEDRCIEETYRQEVFRDDFHRGFGGFNGGFARASRLMGGCLAEPRPGQARGIGKGFTKERRAD